MNLWPLGSRSLFSTTYKSCLGFVIVLLFHLPKIHFCFKNYFFLRDVSPYIHIFISWEALTFIRMFKYNFDKSKHFIAYKVIYEIKLLLVLTYWYRFQTLHKLWHVLVNCSMLKHLESVLKWHTLSRWWLYIVNISLWNFSKIKYAFGLSQLKGQQALHAIHNYIVLQN